MKKIEVKDYIYISDLYIELSEILSKTKGKISDSEVLITVVNFCIFSEKILKIKLSTENKLIPFIESIVKSGTKNAGNIIFSILNDKDLEINTISIYDCLDYYNLFYKDYFLEDELILFKELYRKRNLLIHGHFSDKSLLKEKIEILKSVGTLWEKISNIVIDIFGDKIKRKKIEEEYKYSEVELNKLIESELDNKLKYKDNYSRYGVVSSAQVVPGFRDWSTFLEAGTMVNGAIPYSSLDERCPRCKNISLYKKDFLKPWSSGISSISHIYVCSNCNLELTEREYQIIKKRKSFI